MTATAWDNRDMSGQMAMCPGQAGCGQAPFRGAVPPMPVGCRDREGKRAANVRALVRRVRPAQRCFRKTGAVFENPSHLTANANTAPAGHSQFEMAQPESCAFPSRLHPNQIAGPSWPKPHGSIRVRVLLVGTPILQAGCLGWGCCYLHPFQAVASHTLPRNPMIFTQLRSFPHQSHRKEIRCRNLTPDRPGRREALDWREIP